MRFVRLNWADFFGQRLKPAQSQWIYSSTDLRYFYLGVSILCYFKPQIHNITSCYINFKSTDHRGFIIMSCFYKVLCFYLSKGSEYCFHYRYSPTLEDHLWWNCQRFQWSLYMTTYHQRQIYNAEQRWRNRESNCRNLAQFWPISFIRLTDVAPVSPNLITAPSSLQEKRLLQPPSLLGKETTFN